ncbi:MAG TPA: dTDP-glucose 4,6-dehydratase [Thermoplasmata archaeon]|nr:dTDP-glucose 4,6-dehydratase [Thermoplasmata archaeon]
MEIVVTGGAGFIGSNLVHYWLDRHPDDRMTVVDALTYAGRRESLADLAGVPRFTFLHRSISDAEAMNSAVRGADIVVHLAAESHNDRAIADPMPFVETNVRGTAVLLEACRKQSVPRFHHVSTDEVYGSLSLDDPARFSESTAYRPRGPYSATKAGSDHLVRAWYETYGLPVTVSNSGNNFGPYQFPEKLIPLAITRVLHGGKVPLYGDGQNVRDWIYVLDHCAAIDLISHRGEIGTTYLVSAENELSNLDVIRRILRLMGRTEDRIEWVADRKGHDRRYALDPHRLRENLGWRPEVTFDDGLRTTIEWYTKHEEWWAPLVGDVGGRSP